MATAQSKRMELWMHRKVAEDTWRSKRAGSETLEIGGGTLNHARFEPHGLVYDVVEPWKELAIQSSDFPRVRQLYADMNEIPSSVRYDRIISIATFEHLCDLPRTVALIGLRLKPGGALRAAIPSEGSPLWKLGYKLTTGLEFQIKFKMDYEVLMRHQHVNTWDEIRDVLRYFFSDVATDFLGISAGWSFYQFYACSSPRVEVCRQYLTAKPKKEC